MLFVDDRQPQAGKLHLFLNQRVGTHHNVGRAAFNGRQQLLPECLALGTLEEDHSQTKGLDKCLDIKRVLLGENLGRGHHRRLVAILHSRQHRAQAH